VQFSRIFRIAIIVFLFFFLFNNCTEAYLVKIGNETYTQKDFMWWWNHWKEPSQKFPKNLKPFIRWLLFLKEAEKMELYKNPFYKRRVLIYRKVRDLLRLQYEEVEKKIHINDKVLWNFYQKNFIPLCKIKGFFLNERSEAKELKNKIKDLKSCNELFKKIKSIQKGEFWIRPWSTPKEVKDIVFSNALKQGEILGPLKWEKSWAIICIEEVKKGGKKDFERIKEALRRIYKKLKEGELTDLLIKKLKKKYKIYFNKKLYEKVGFGKLPEGLKNKILLKIDGRYLTAERFREMLLQEKRFRFAMVNPESKKSVEKFKKFILNTIIAQNLVEIEALNRGYENQEPLKSDLDFYKKNLLVRGFINYVIVPKIKVSKAEVEEYFKLHKKEFPGKVKVIAVYLETSDGGLVKKIKEEVLEGKTVEEVLKELGFKDYIVHKFVNEFPIFLQKYILNAEPNKLIIKKFGRYYYIFKILDKEEIPPKLNDYLKKVITQKLEEQRFKKVEEQIYEKLKKEYHVKINLKAWMSLRERMQKHEN